jgi:hypothetical protein
LLAELVDAGVRFIVVGGAAAVLQGAPVSTLDLDIVHERTEENVDRLLALLLRLRAYHRFDLANRKLPPTRGPMFGTGHLNLETAFGPLDVLCELALGEGYEQIVADTDEVSLAGSSVRVLGLRRLIAVKTAAGRQKDLQVLPVLIATLEERGRRDELPRPSRDLPASRPVGRVDVPRRARLSLEGFAVDDTFGDRPCNRVRSVMATIIVEPALRVEGARVLPRPRRG